MDMTETNIELNVPLITLTKYNSSFHYKSFDAIKQSARIIKTSATRGDSHQQKYLSFTFDEAFGVLSLIHI